MMGAGIIVAAVMMGVMFLFGHKMGHQHEHGKPASQEVTVSSSTAISTVPVQNAAPVVKDETPPHEH